MIAAALALAALHATPAGAFEYPGNRLVNPGAEAGLAGWQGAGLGAVQYDAEAIPRHPAPWTLPSQSDAGAWLFSAAADAAIWQVVDLTDLAATIDAGAQPLSFGALLGGRAQHEYGARLLVQPLDAGGASIGAPSIVGAPSRRDRQSQTGLLNCNASTTAPAGTRAVLVRLEAVGGAGGLADNTYLLPGLLPQPASLGPRPADGPGCRTEGALQPPQPSCASKFTTKLALARASTVGGVIDVLAPITARASGAASVDFHAAGRHTRFSTKVQSADGRIRFRRSVPRSQARLQTGILTIAYPGDADTREQSVRLRAAVNKARLRLSRPRIMDGRILTSGRITSSARGVVRLQLEYQTGCEIRVLRFKGTIKAGRWSIDQRLAPQDLAEMARRTGTVQSHTLFTGYLAKRIRASAARCAPTRCLATLI